LQEFYRGEMSCRELGVLIRHLPQESWTQTALRDMPGEQLLAAPATGERKFGPWALVNHQLAALGDAVMRLEVTVARSNGADWKYPDPTPRPGAARPVRKQSEANVLYLESLRARG
jgi:hypothetical protein